MRHDPAGGAVVIMLRGLKMHGMAQAVGELMEQGAPAFDAAVPILSQLLKAETAEREVRSIAYQIKAARFPTYKDLAGFDFASSEVNEALVRQLHRGDFMHGAHNAVLSSRLLSEKETDQNTPKPDRSHTRKASNRRIRTPKWDRTYWTYHVLPTQYGFILADPCRRRYQDRNKCLVSRGTVRSQKNGGVGGDEFPVHTENHQLRSTACVCRFRQHLSGAARIQRARCHAPLSARKP